MQKPPGSIRHKLPARPLAFGHSSRHTAHISKLTADAALASLNSSPIGLSEKEAERRRQEFGYNQVEEVRGTPLWARFAREFTHFFAVILWVAAGLAFFAEHMEPDQGMRQLGTAIIGVILINGLFSFWQEYRADKSIQSIQSVQEVKR